MPHKWCPQQVERRHKSTATIATDRDVGEGLHPNHHRLPHVLDTKSVALFSSPLHLLHRKKPDTTRSTTMTPPASTSQPPTPPQRRRRTSNTVEKHQPLSVV
jgi:hypothetical protein